MCFEDSFFSIGEGFPVCVYTRPDLPLHGRGVKMLRVRGLSHCDATGNINNIVSEGAGLDLAITFT